MKKKHVLLFIFLTMTLLYSSAANDAERKDVFGYWVMMDPRTNQQAGIAYVFEKDGIIYSRILVAVHPKTQAVSHYKAPQIKAPYIKDQPYVEGMVNIWNVTWSDQEHRYINGFILDPQVRKPYRLEMWREGNELKIKGIMGPFSKTVSWYRATERDLPQGCPPVKGPPEPPVIYY
jgi:hypothetical protein